MELESEQHDRRLSLPEQRRSLKRKLEVDLRDEEEASPSTPLHTSDAQRKVISSEIKTQVYYSFKDRVADYIESLLQSDTGRKVDDPELLEAIRLTIINNLLEYHPESSTKLAMGAASGVTAPTQQVDIDIATRVKIYDDGPKRSLLYVETADRPGLLVDLVKIVTEISVAIQSGEFDTEGLLAQAKFHVSYRDQPINKNLQLVLANSLRYFLRRPATDESGY